MYTVQVFANFFYYLWCDISCRISDIRVSQNAQCSGISIGTK